MVDCIGCVYEEKKGSDVPCCDCVRASDELDYYVRKSVCEAQLAKKEVSK